MLAYNLAWGKINYTKFLVILCNFSSNLFDLIKYAYQTFNNKCSPKFFSTMSNVQRTFQLHGGTILHIPYCSASDCILWIYRIGSLNCSSDGQYVGHCTIPGAWLSSGNLSVLIRISPESLLPVKTGITCRIMYTVKLVSEVISFQQTTCTGQTWSIFLFSFKNMLSLF